MTEVDRDLALKRARLSLTGLWAGDAFGGSFFWSDASARVEERRLSDPPWRWSDDTAMGKSVVRCLEIYGQVLPDTLARLFVAEYLRDCTRGYGSMAHTILSEIWHGVPWSQAAAEAFDGQGSYGNGAAMRAAPIGAYFAENIEQVVHQARQSAIVTHAHPEGQAGAIAVAAAAAWAARADALDGAAMLRWVCLHTPVGETRSNLERALDFSLERTPQEAAAWLGSGQKVSSQDTVPFALWCAARHLDSYEEALWATVAGIGDLDSNCAIVGSVVVLCARSDIPQKWLEEAEPMDLGAGC